MEINKDYLLEMKTSLDNQMKRLIADANAVRGALQVIDAHLNYLEALDVSKEEVK